MNSSLQTAIIAALKAGEKIRQIYEDPATDFEIEQKADHSPLTIADRLSNEIITADLKNTPYPILSEESQIVAFETRRQWQTLWIVDPLDGTKEFIQRNGEFTVNIALVNEGQPVLGVIYIPIKQTLYYGTLEEGAYRISSVVYHPDSDFNELQALAQRLPLERKDFSYRVVASRSHRNAETDAFIRQLQQQQAEVKLISVGSSIKICLVAEGSADIYPRFAPTMEWDTAAGHAIAKAAGKEIYHEDGKTPLSYNKENLLNPWFIVK